MILLCKQSIYSSLVLFCATAVVSMPRLANFSPCEPLIFVLAPLLMLLYSLKIDLFSNVHR